MKRRLVTIAVLVVTALLCHDRSAAQSAKPTAAPAATTAAITPAEVDGLLAPVALYPDPLLAQMLLCAASPPTVVELHAWLAKNATLKGTALQDAATVEGFEPSFVAMALFPQVVSFMAENVTWTTRLGQVFAADREAVFGSIQRLRKDAHASGALKATPQQTVETKTTTSGDQVIVIEPANPQVVYVPQYSPQVVYTQPVATTVVIEDDDDVDAAVAGVIGFTAGIAIGAAFDNDYYYGPYGWHGGGYMYNDAWDDYYDHREDAREDWIDHREDLVEERGERTREAGDQRTERAEGRQETRSGSQAERTERQQTRQETGTTGTRTTDAARATEARTAAQGRSADASGYTARGHSGTSPTASRDRAGTTSDAFSGYSNGRSERTASTRGHTSRSGSSRGGASRGGGGRRR